jgi:hypothetical protein
MRRRALIPLLGGAAPTWAPAARARRHRRVRKIAREAVEHGTALSAILRTQSADGIGYSPVNRAKSLAEASRI